MTATGAGARLSRQALPGVLVLAAAFAVLAGLAVLPFLWAAHTQETIAERQAEVRFLEARVNKAPAGSRAGFVAGDDVRPVFLSASTPGLGHAALQRLVDRLAEDSGLAVERIQPLQSDEAGDLTTLRMEVEATGSIEALQQFLIALEAGTPFVFVSGARMAPGRPGEAEGGALPSENLVISLQLEAFAWREAP